MKEWFEGLAEEEAALRALWDADTDRAETRWRESEAEVARLAAEILAETRATIH